VTRETFSYHTIGPDTSINLFINNVNPVNTIPNTPIQPNQLEALQESKLAGELIMPTNIKIVEGDKITRSPLIHTINTPERSDTICFRNIPSEFEMDIDNSSGNKHLELRKHVL